MMSVRSSSRQSAMWPAEWPGASIREAGDLVALAQAAGDRVRRSGEGSLREPVQRVGGLARGDASVLERRGVTVPGPQGDAEVLADRVAGPLVIRVGVGHDVGGERPAVELTNDAPPGVAGGRVDEHSSRR